MRLQRPARRAQTDNTIALINVVFLMLIFFLFAGSLEPNDAHDVTPPDVAMEREKTDTGGALVIRRDGTMRRDGVDVPRERLAERLRGEAGADGAPLRVVADRDLPASVLSEVLASAREAGRGKIVLVARRAPDREAGRE